VKDCFPAEENLSLLSLPLKSKMLII
jgi:hypothetical protein